MIGLKTRYKIWKMNWHGKKHGLKCGVIQLTREELYLQHMESRLSRQIKEVEFKIWEIQKEILQKYLLPRDRNHSVEL